MPGGDSSAKPVGRFAPTPSGPPHFGTVLAAVASFLNVRSRSGEWRLRIEDIDLPRAAPGAVDAILRQLESLGLHWDGDIMYQSQRGEAYGAALAQLRADGLLYPCACARGDYAGAPMGVDGPVYPGTCSNGLPAGKSGRSLRVRVPDQPIEFCDGIMGYQQQRLDQAVGDFVLRRADVVIAYQLAVVVDDAAQAVTQVLRGADLLTSTARQIYLQQRLRLPTPEYLHIPLLLDANGDKLSKSDGRHPLPAYPSTQLLWVALQALGQQPPAGLRKAPVAEQLQWAQQHWSLDKLSRQPIAWRQVECLLNGWQT